jgi:hypothetical protein
MKKPKQTKTSKEKYQVGFYTVGKYEFPVILGEDSIGHLYGTKKKHKYPMLGVVYDHAEKFACMFCNAAFFKISDELKQIFIAHEIGHICCGHSPEIKPNDANEYITQEHQADTFAAKIYTKEKVLWALDQLKLCYGKKVPDTLEIRKILLDDSWDGPMPVLKESKEALTYKKNNKRTIKQCHQMFMSVDLSGAEQK